MLSFVLAAVAVALHAPEMARHAPLMARSQRAAVRMNEPTEPTEPFDPTNPKQRAQIDAIKEQMKAAVLRGRAAGRTDEQILEDSELLQKLASDLGLDDDAQTSPEPLPSSGEEEWGGWEQTDELISIMLAVDSSARAKDVACKLEDGVSLQVALRGQKLLGGTLAQEVLADELFWCFEEERDGGKYLLLEMPKRRRQSGRFEEALFIDLRVGAEEREFGAAGLVAGFGGLPVGEAVYADADPRQSGMGQVVQGKSPSPVPQEQSPADELPSDLGNLIPDELWQSITGGEGLVEDKES